MCNPEHTKVLYPLAVISGIIILSVLPILFKFISAHLRLKHEKPDLWSKKQPIYYFGLLFIITNIVALFEFFILHVVALLGIGCNKDLMNADLYIVFIPLYLLQTYCLLLLSVYRIHSVFKGTSLQFSKCTTRLHMVIFIILLMIILIVAATITLLSTIVLFSHDFLHMTWFASNFLAIFKKGRLYRLSKDYFEISTKYKTGTGMIFRQ